MPVAWRCPFGSGQIQTSRQAGGMASARMRSIAGPVSIRSPLWSRYLNPRPHRTRRIPGAEQSALRSLGIPPVDSRAERTTILADLGFLPRDCGLSAHNWRSVVLLMLFAVVAGA